MADRGARAEPADRVGGVDGESLQLAVIEDRVEYQLSLAPDDAQARGRRPVPFHVIVAKTGYAFGQCGSDGLAALVPLDPPAPLHQQAGLPKVAATPGFVDANTLLRFSLPPRTVSVRTTGTTLVVDSQPRFSTARMIVKFDTLHSTVRPVNASSRLISRL